MSRHCAFVQTADQKWYVLLARREYAGPEDAVAYGPLASMQACDEYLRNGPHANPGAVYEEPYDAQRPPDADTLERIARAQPARTRAESLFGGYGLGYGRGW